MTFFTNDFIYKPEVYLIRF